MHCLTKQKFCIKALITFSISLTVHIVSLPPYHILHTQIQSPNSSHHTQSLILHHSHGLGLAIRDEEQYHVPALLLDPAIRLVHSVEPFALQLHHLTDLQGAQEGVGKCEGWEARGRVDKFLEVLLFT